MNNDAKIVCDKNQTYGKFGNSQPYENRKYHHTSNISHTLVGNKIVDHSDLVEASPVGAVPTTSSFST